MAGSIRETPAGTWRAYWRDPAGRQTSKTFGTKREATAFLAQMKATTSNGGYVSPHAGRGCCSVITRGSGWPPGTTRRPPTSGTRRSCERT